MLTIHPILGDYLINLYMNISHLKKIELCRVLPTQGKWRVRRALYLYLYTIIFCEAICHANVFFLLKKIWIDADENEIFVPASLTNSQQTVQPHWLLTTTSMKCFAQRYDLGWGGEMKSFWQIWSHCYGNTWNRWTRRDNTNIFWDK